MCRRYWQRFFERLKFQASRALRSWRMVSKMSFKASKNTSKSADRHDDDGCALEYHVMDL